MKKSTKILLAVLSGLLLPLAYFKWGHGFMIFIGLIPLLLVEEANYQERKNNRTLAITPYAFISFALFTLLSVWWVMYSVGIALVAAVIINPLFQVAPFTIFHAIKRKLGSRLGYLSLIVLWVAFEFLFLNIQVNCPWIILGNAFAKNVAFIQWYEITGTLGGSLWILTMNILLLKLLQGFRKNKSFSANKNKLSWVLGFFLVPALFSLIRFYTYEEKHDPYNVVVVQPNIDPWKKFVDFPQEKQTAILLNLADSAANAETDYMVGPETYINNSVWHRQMRIHKEYLKIWDFMDKYPNASLVTGSMTYRRYSPTESLPESARKLGNTGDYYSSFNSAVQFDTTRLIQMYHKSKLVTGAEWMPNLDKFPFLKKLNVDLGGITRSHGISSERKALIAPQSGCKVGTVICWESIFGEFVTGFVKDSEAELIFVITNDGWWRNTAGHRQHNDYAHLRAIETRRSIARSANTGISSLINQKGQEIERIGWWERGAISGTLNANDHKTFYVKHGNFVARISALLSVLLVLASLVARTPAGAGD